MYAHIKKVKQFLNLYETLTDAYTAKMKPYKYYRLFIHKAIARIHGRTPFIFTMLPQRSIIKYNLHLRENSILQLIIKPI
ncbi:hypothetical protein D770_02755 [Flammeovirgaceae bacterium 311]|nr:hypothetical protein D770_02755 [Flammeovirgaceae bacterium 311]